MKKNLHTEYISKSKLEFLSSFGDKHVLLLVGGMSAERDVSIMSGKGVGKSLVELGYRVTKVDMGADIANVITSLSPDIVFNCLHGTYGEDGCVPGLLDILHIPYTHSGVLTSALAFNKAKSREIFQGCGIKCAEGKIIHKDDDIKSDPLSRPYIIKPLSQGSSIGIEVVFEDDEFDFAKYKFEYGDEILVEKFISGRELQVAVLNGKALGVLEIKVLKNRFYDYETKYNEGMAEHIVPAKIPEDIYKKAMDLSENVNKTFYATGMVRIEMIYHEEENELYMLELNTHPGMTKLSICPEIAALKNITYTDIVKDLVENATFYGDENKKLKLK